MFDRFSIKNRDKDEPMFLKEHVDLGKTTAK